MLNNKKPQLINGYIAYYNTKGNNYDYEHDIVMDKLLNHKLQENEVVHHLDLNKVNNNTENLIYLDLGQHTKLHSWIKRGCPINKKRIQNINTALKESRRCKLSSCNNIVKDIRNMYCSVNCRMKDADENSLIWRAKSNQSKIKQWPDIDTLIKKVNKKGYVKTGEEYQVSDKAVAKRIQKFNRQDEIIDFRKRKKKKK